MDRYYDPATDQFVTVDPDLAETDQAYAFTGDDPLNATDPNGLCPQRGKRNLKKTDPTDESNPTQQEKEVGDRNAQKRASAKRLPPKSARKKAKLKNVPLPPPTNCEPSPVADPTPATVPVTPSAEMGPHQVQATASLSQLQGVPSISWGDLVPLLVSALPKAIAFTACAGATAPETAGVAAVPAGAACAAAVP